MISNCVTYTVTSKTLPAFLYIPLNIFDLQAWASQTFLASVAITFQREREREISSHVRCIWIWKFKSSRARRNIIFWSSLPGSIWRIKDFSIHKWPSSYKGPCQSHRRMKVMGNNNQLHFIILSNKKGGDGEVKWERKSDMHAKSVPPPSSPKPLRPAASPSTFSALSFISICHALLPPSAGEAARDGERNWYLRFRRNETFRCEQSYASALAAAMKGDGSRHTAHST